MKVLEAQRPVTQGALSVSLIPEHETALTVFVTTDSQHADFNCIAADLAASNLIGTSVRSLHVEDLKKARSVNRRQHEVRY